MFFCGGSLWGLRDFSSGLVLPITPPSWHSIFTWPQLNICLNAFVFPFRCSGLWSDRWLKERCSGRLLRPGSSGQSGHGTTARSTSAPRSRGLLHVRYRIPLAAVLPSSKRWGSYSKDTVSKQQNWYSKPGLLTTKPFCCEVESPQQIQNLQLNNFERRMEFHHFESSYICIFLSMTRDTELTCKSSSGLQSIQSHTNSWRVRESGNLYLVLQVNQIRSLP